MSNPTNPRGDMPLEPSEERPEIYNAGGIGRLPRLNRRTRPTVQEQPRNPVEVKKFPIKNKGKAATPAGPPKKSNTAVSAQAAKNFVDRVLPAYSSMVFARVQDAIKDAIKESLSDMQEVLEDIVGAGDVPAAE